MATIGYGTSDYYFGECWTPFLLVLLQVFSAIVFSSLAIGLLFQRMSRGQKRGRTIVFSDCAVVRRVGGVWHLMFRLAELRRGHIIGARVRAFLVRHERCPAGEDCGGGDGSRQQEMETAHFVSHQINLVGDGGSSGPEQSIIMGLPQVVVHRMDGSSPLLPGRPVWYDRRGVPHGPQPAAGSDGGPLGGDGDGNNGRQPTQEEIAMFLADRCAELVVFVEGTCENTGMALQSRHSYRIEDVAFHRTFEECVFPAVGGGSSGAVGGGGNGRLCGKADGARAALEVDFARFHRLAVAPYDCASCPYVPTASV